MPYKVRFTRSLNDLLERSTLGGGLSGGLTGLAGGLLPIGLSYLGIAIESPLFFVVCFGLLGCLVAGLLVRKRRIKQTIPDYRLEIENGVLRTFSEDGELSKAELSELNPALTTEYIRTAASLFVKIPYFRLSLTTDGLGRQDLFFLVDGDYHLAQTHKLLSDYVVRGAAVSGEQPIESAAF